MKKRIEQLRQKIRKVVRAEPRFVTKSDGPPEVEAMVPDRSLAFETSQKRMLIEVLSELQVELPRPKKLTDRELACKLWEVIHALLRRSVVLCNTDHLSDRELYALLWNETLRKEYVLTPDYPVHIDMTKTGPDNGMPIYLKYYASETQRSMYLKVYPDFKMPGHIEPPRRRDHLIPEDPSREGQARKPNVN